MLVLLHFFGTFARSLINNKIMYSNTKFAANNLTHSKIFMNSLDFVSPVFHSLSKEAKNKISKADVMFILNLEQSYYRKSSANSINRTAFMDVVEYIVEEARHSDENFSYRMVAEVLEVKEQYSN
jgi:hypothetical protein